MHLFFGLGALRPLRAQETQVFTNDKLQIRDKANKEDKAMKLHKMSNQSRTGLLVGMVAFAAAAMCPLGAFATAYYVDPKDGNDSADGLSDSTPLKTFSKAMEKTKNDPSPEIVLMPGTYPPGMDFSGRTGLKIRGLTGIASDVIIDGTNTAYGMKGSSTNVLFSSMTFRNCFRSSTDSSHGPAIRFSNQSGGTDTRSDNVVSNCVFENCRSEYTAGNGSVGTGAVFAFGGTSFFDCTFRTNSAAQGGGAVQVNDNHSSIPQSRFVRCRFEGNYNYGVNKDAGAVYLNVSSTNAMPVVFEDCVFDGNAATRNGGAVYGISTRFYRCTFADNCATNNGGAFYDPTSDNQAKAALTTNLFYDCTFTGNRAHNMGGVYSWNQSTIMSFSNCTFVANSADVAGAVIGTGTYHWRRCDMIDCLVTNNSAVTAGQLGGIVNQRNQAGHPSGEFLRCRFVDNKTRGNCSALRIGYDAVVEKCAFIGNEIIEAPAGSALNNGGALYIQGTNATIRNCLFYGNKNWQGSVSAVYVGVSNCLKFEHNTIVSNGAVSVSDSGAYSVYIPNGKVTRNGNNIYFGGHNLTNGVWTSNKGFELYYWGDNLAITNNYYTTGGVRNGTAFGCLTGNDPGFKDPANGDFTLKSRSPCRNYGADLSWNTAPGATDITDKNPRLEGSAPDLGCYEHVLTGFMLLFR